MSSPLAFPPGEPPRYGAYPEGAWDNLLALRRAAGLKGAAAVAPETLHSIALVAGFNDFSPDAATRLAVPPER